MGTNQKNLGQPQNQEAQFEPIPRPQGPFRSGQDNQEPIYDNSNKDRS